MQRRASVNFLGVACKYTDSMTGFRLRQGRYWSLNTAIESITFIILLNDITEATSGQAGLIKKIGRPARKQNQTPINGCNRSVDSLCSICNYFP